MTGENYSAVSEQFPDEAGASGMQDSDAGVLGTIAGRAGRMANAVAIWFVILLAAVFAYELVARHIFNSPTGFANQLAAYGMPFIAFLAAARTLAVNGHVTVDVFVLKLSRKSRARLEIATDAVSVLVLLVVTWIAFAVLFESWQTGYKAFSTAFTFPEYLPQIVMPAGLTLLTLQQVARLVGCVRGYGAGAPDGKL